jgi:replicative DNA helicase
VTKRAIKLISGKASAVVPHDWESERVVLGGILSDPTLYRDLQSDVGLSRDDLHHPAHQALWDLMARLPTPDLLSAMSAAMQSEELAGHIGGVGYVAALPSACPSVAGVMARARALRAITVRRALLLAADQIRELAADVVAPPDELLSAAKGAVEGASQLQTARTWTDGGKAAGRALDALVARMRGEGGGIVFMWPKLTEKLGKMRPKKLWILGGRPAMGKSSLASQMALMAAQQGIGAGIISLEMDVSECAERALCQIAGVNAGAVRDGEITPDQWRELQRGQEILDGLPIWFEYVPGLTLSRLRGLAYQLRLESQRRGHPFGLLVVDYLQLMGGMPVGMSKNDFYGEITRSVKQLAGELECSILLLSQLNRNLESRTEKAPQMGDFRDSGAIEADADVILYVYRPEVYDENHRVGEVDIGILKGRSGQIGVVACAWEGRHYRFGGEVAPRMEEERPKTIRRVRG